VEEEEGAVGAIVDKLWKDLQIERVSKNRNTLFGSIHRLQRRLTFQNCTASEKAQGGKRTVLSLAIQCRQA